MSLYILNQNIVFNQNNGKLYFIEERKWQQMRSNEWKLLSLLIENAGQDMTASSILNTIWQQTRTKSSVVTSVKNLRRLLNDDPANPRVIQTVVMKGYTLIADLTELSEKEFESLLRQQSTLRKYLRNWVFFNKQAISLFTINAIAIGCIAYYSLSLYKMEAHVRLLKHKADVGILPVMVVGHFSDAEFDTEICEALITVAHQNATFSDLPVIGKRRFTNYYPYLAWSDSNKRNLLCLLSPTDG
jgi:DNA-binding winged helix-turn-helix (wHTH) protein